MPELPEVETVRRGLEPAMLGQKLTSVNVRRRDLRWPVPDRFEACVTGATVKSLRRRSKYILADFNNHQTMIIHLGMSGRILISGLETGNFVHQTKSAEKHDHVVFEFGSGAIVTYNDPRRFGMMDVTPTKEAESHKLLRQLGPEPLGNGFGPGELASALKGRKSPIKTALLDQKIVAGLGNIYVCEALHRAGVSPSRQAGRVSKARIESLVHEIRAVLEEAIRSGGSSLKDHKQTNGELGYFQHHFQAYNREGKACKTKDCAGQIRRIVQSGRSTFYCPSCQS